VDPEKVRKREKKTSPPKVRNFVPNILSFTVPMFPILAASASFPPSRNGVVLVVSTAPNIRLFLAEIFLLRCGIGPSRERFRRRNYF
jgi:hypothetical protein